MLLHEALPREIQSSDVSGASSWREKLDTAFAFGALLAVDASMKLAGFHRFYRLVRGFPTFGENRTTDEARVERICSAVDRAASFYFKRAWCLQRSATAVCLLRLGGIAAELVIGVRKMPFYGHAWAEIGGRVVNDSPVVKSRYVVLERC